MLLEAMKFIPDMVYSHESAAFIHGLHSEKTEQQYFTVLDEENMSNKSYSNDNHTIKYLQKELFELGKIDIASAF